MQLCIHRMQRALYRLVTISHNMPFFPFPEDTPTDPYNMACTCYNGDPGVFYLLQPCPPAYKWCGDEPFGVCCKPR